MRAIQGRSLALIVALCAPLVAAQTPVSQSIAGAPSSSFQALQDRVSSIERRIGRNVDAYGADPSGRSDSCAAFTAASDALQPGDVLVGDGTYSLSCTVMIDAFRTGFDVQGRIQPYGRYSGYLLEFKAPGADTGGFNNLALKIDFRGLIVDGKLRSRGVRFDQLYLSQINNLSVFNAYGTAVAIDNSMEDSWLGLVIANGKKRAADWKDSATAWSNGTSYRTGSHVYVAYPGYSPGTTYAANDFVSYRGRSYRSVYSSNAQHSPDASPAFWQPVPTEYFEAMRGSTGRDPQAPANYTTNSTVTGNRIWKQVYESEAALEIVNTYGSEVVDNQKFFAPYFRHNDHDVLVRIDNQANDRRASNIEFYGPQFHEIIQPYLTAFPGTGQTLANYSTIVQIGYAMRCKFFGGTTRSSEAVGVTHFQLGWKNPAKLSQNILITGVDMSGEGAGNYGISIMPSARGIITANDNEFAFTNNATSPRTVGDTSRLASLRSARDILPAAVPAHFSPTKMILITDASGNSYYVPAMPAPGW